MQKLIETLKQFGVEIPEDKHAEVKKALSEHYKNVGEHNKAISKLEAERDKWKGQAETAEETLKSFEGIDPENIQKELDGWKEKAKEAEEKAQKQIYERDFSDALKNELSNYKFSSELAKKAVMSEIQSAGLKLKDGKILGLSDLLSQIKETDSAAFADDTDPNNIPRFTNVITQTKANDKMTKKEIDAIKDPVERKAAIKQHLDLYM